MFFKKKEDNSKKMIVLGFLGIVFVIGIIVGYIETKNKVENNNSSNNNQEENNNELNQSINGIDSNLYSYYTFVENNYFEVTFNEVTEYKLGERKNGSTTNFPVLKTEQSNKPLYGTFTVNSDGTVTLLSNEEIPSYVATKINYNEYKMNLENVKSVFSGYAGQSGQNVIYFIHNDGRLSVITTDLNLIPLYTAFHKYLNGVSNVESIYMGTDLTGTNTIYAKTTDGKIMLLNINEYGYTRNK